MIHTARKATEMKIQTYFIWGLASEMCYNLLWKLLLDNVTSTLTWCDSLGFGATKWTILTHTQQLEICWTGVVIMPAAVVYLCIALFTELLNLAGGDIPVLITVSTLVERQASADSTLPRSWIIKTHHFILSDTLHTSVVLLKKKKKR